MTLNELLSSPEASLPKTRENGCFYNYFKKITDDYFLLARKLNADGDISSKIKDNIPVSIEIRDVILKAIQNYLNGNPSATYINLKSIIKNNFTLFQELVSKTIDTDYLRNLYRAREIDDHFFSKNEMFHIPFNLRHLVATQRYSIPGFPSLYLSSSVFTAWKELSCPDLNKLVVVRVQPTQKVKFLDFGLPPLYLAQQDIDWYDRAVTNFSGLLASQVIIWPLLAACSISVLKKKSTFKPEYIVPQIVLQLLRNNVFGKNIHGIRYFSTNYGNKYHSLTLGSNFVFPVKNSQPSGLCPDLIKLFHLTEPISWQLANTATSEFDATKTNDGGIEVITGIPISYRTTQFARVEVNLIEQAATSL